MMLTRTKGMTATEVVIVLIIVGILVAMAIPGFLRASRTSSISPCQENLVRIYGAKTSWALDMKKPDNATVDMATLVKADEIGWLAKEPVCPDGGVYTVNPIGVDPTCSIAGTKAKGPHCLP